MKIFIISLPRSTTRRAAIKSTLDEKDIPFEFFDAIDGKVEEHPIFNQYNEKKRLHRKGYSLMPGEKGCFASHFDLWQRCVELNHPIVVLEDDIDVLDNFKRVVPILIKHADKYGFIRLLTFLDDKHIVFRESIEGINIVGYKKPALGTPGYVISPKAAFALIEATQEWFEPVDDFIDNEWRHKAGVYCVQPDCIAHLDGASDIGDRKKQKVSIVQRIKRELYRTLEKVQLTLYIRLFKRRK